MRLRETLILALALASANAASATTWHDGDMVTWTQADWGDIPNGSNIASTLYNNYFTVYPSADFEIGLMGTAGYSAAFTNPQSLIDYLPADGAVGALDADLIDPFSTASGSFGGDVAATLLNIDFSDAGLLSGTAPLRFGDLHVYALTTTADLNNLTVRQVLDVLNTALGGGPTIDSIDDLDLLARELQGSFFLGTPSTFAQDHLQAPVPEPSTLLLLVSGVAVVAARRSRVRPT